MKHLVYWIFIANARTARVLETIDAITKKKFKEIKTFYWEASRKLDHDLGTDKAGQGREGNVTSHHSYDSKTDLHKHEKQHFAEITAEFINENATSNKFDKLIVIASPEFLGELRHHLNKHSHNNIFRELNKDLTHFTNEEVVDYLIEHRP